ncbi:hypothetical protein OS493_036579 [Desmophyllum pertusum]|uniref:Uncharacterized protein n=1 Tax=Desmophyllum pertusum TaxID=174260 RepID=A0A9X0CCN6_9CNID|nr:hypothetical protein OS493_036579 [Desmophyllum pertusum]
MFLKMAAGMGDAEIVDAALAGTADATPTVDVAMTVDAALTGKVEAALAGKDAAVTGTGKVEAALAGKDAAVTGTGKVEAALAGKEAAVTGTGKVDATLAGTVATAGTNDAAVDTELAGIGTDCVGLKRRFTSLLTCGCDNRASRDRSS